ncbi:MAG TPA: F0F1 ATP synthase subunit A [Phenylobacterium sp.]|jgi:F-type H+-transporting ATPase subunit a|uniref:F0F1 ATP synthase subunit A n=1 Tax=Phenylobacterium sp. TaxID=1871053 RepID=UPI002CD562B1|nr:F0F1 ATP synthase subunit A [Phenylobacterium sp.]HXA38369.1 F0F1 ATP synthase subunit A [Phenylobacterium sp.]
MANQPAIQPMEQFMVHKIVDLPVVHIGGMALDLSITNSVASMIAGAIVLVLFFALTARREIVPNRGQALAESLYNIIDRVLVGPIIGHEGKPYVPYIFSLFLVILVLNLMSVVLAIFNIGGMELTFAVTAQLAITATLAVLTFFSVFILGFVKHGPKFLTLFAPSGMPKVMLVFMVPIEMLSYFVRPVTLAMRLFGNMLGGHVVMSLFGSFVVALGILALSGGVATLAFIPSALSFSMIVALTGLELVVAVLQAFVFAALATVYLNEVVNFGHGH